MVLFTRSLAAWKTPAFEDVLKNEIAGLDADRLPLQQGLSQGSYSIDRGISAMVISSQEDAGFIRVKAGIFYSSIIAGCSCADDPTPIDENSEYCLVQFDISKRTAEVRITYVTE